MRLTATARLAVNDDGTVTIVVKSFAATLDKREQLALWKSCGNPVDGLCPPQTPKSTETRELDSKYPDSTVPAGLIPVPSVPTQYRQVDQKIKASTPFDFSTTTHTPGELAIRILIRCLRESGQDAMTHDALRDAAYRVAAEDIPDHDDLDLLLSLLWNATFWANRPELSVTSALVREARPL